MTPRLKVGITSGDPAGIGPEIVAKALASGQLAADTEYVLLGDPVGHTPGKSTAASARASLEALEEAARVLLSGELLGVVTGPVSKEALHKIGYTFPGQTEFFAARAGVEDFAMCLTGGKITVALVTAHVPLAEVSALLTEEKVVRTARLLARFLRERGHNRPRIAVAGLNPHAGEGGDIGSEEIDLISPAVELLQAEKAAIFSGPYPADTLFFRCLEDEFDGVVCMYHDQGLIPLKMHAFHEGVNVTLGLPFVRTSPDHGTAFDLAGTGRARPDSMIAALRLASDLCRARIRFP